MPPNAAASRSPHPLPGPTSATAATGTGGDPAALSGAESRAQGLRVAPDAGGYATYGVPILRALPEIHLARKPLQLWMTTTPHHSGMCGGYMTCDALHSLAASFEGRNSICFAVKRDVGLSWASQPPYVTQLKSRYHFGDANEHVQAMTEMNGASFSTKRLRIGPGPSNRTFDNSTQGTDSYHDPNSSRLFVGCLDQSISDGDLLRAFSPYGELINVKVLASKACGFVTYSNRLSAPLKCSLTKWKSAGSRTIYNAMAGMDTLNSLTRPYGLNWPSLCSIAKNDDIMGFTPIGERMLEHYRELRRLARPDFRGGWAPID
ncbi:unnamed protein product [Urochloa humidicola]